MSRNNSIIIISMVIIFLTLIVYLNEPDEKVENKEEIENKIPENINLKQVSNSTICKDLNMRVYNDTYCYNT